MPLAFTGTHRAKPEEEREKFGALAAAIADAATQAAGSIKKTKKFRVTDIVITVAPNPGPKAYTATITEAPGR